VKIDFYLPLEAFSINSVYYRDRRHKTQSYRDWERRAFQCLHSAEIQEKLKSIREAYKEDEHCFSVAFDFQMSALFNKQGKISSRAEDLSNVEKMLLDILFLPKYHVQPWPDGVPNLNADDKYVLELSSKKTHSVNDGTHITIALIPVPENLNLAK